MADPGPSRRRRLPRKYLIAAVGVILVGAGLGIWLGTRSSSASPLKITTQVVAVTTGTMKQTVSASGTIEPAEQANLDFAVSGKVTAVEVSTGQSVTAGQTLATVDPSALQAALDSAKASVTSAQAKLSSDESANASASQIDGDDASVTSAESALSTAETNLSDSTLTSTIAGTVASVDLSVGQQVSGTSSSSGSSPSGSSGSSSPGSSIGASTSSSASSSTSSAQIVVIATKSYTVSASVDDTEVGQLKVGDQAVITPSSSSTPGYGTVSSVGLIATESSNVATFPVTVAVTGSPSGFYAGATASVSITVKQINDAIEVPTAAISYSGGQAKVTVVHNGQHTSRAVTTGESSGGDTQITSGLRAGEKVLEQVVTFNGTSGAGGRSLFGGSGTTGGGFPSGGSFPSGAGFPRGGTGG